MDGVAGGGTGAYDGSTTPTRRYVSIASGGHLVGGNLCTLRDPTDSSIDIVDLAEKYKLGGPLLGVVGVRNVFGALFDGCNEKPDDATPFIPASRGIEIMNYASTGAFEEMVGRYRAAGVNEFVIDAPGPAQFPVLERVATDVIPRLRRG